MTQPEFGGGAESNTALVVRPLSVKPEAVLRLRVEKIGVAAPPANVEFSYTVTVAGVLERIVRSSAPGQPSILVVDGCAYAVPAGTLIEIETGEIR